MFIALELSQTSTKLTFPVAGLQHMPQCQVICCPSNHFLPLKQSSCNLSKYLNLEKSQLKNFAGNGDWTRVCSSQAWLWCIYCWIALMQAWNSEIGSPRWGVKALSLEVPCQASWCRCQIYPTWVAYHRRHPISTVPVARITAHATVPGNSVPLFVSRLSHLLFVLVCVRFQLSFYLCVFLYAIQTGAPNFPFFSLSFSFLFSLQTLPKSV